ncbi:MAG: class I SAM-dependent methyltransferase [Caldilineaceae bacterium]|nr:class I SAM-dependent methyltransferase [Caldilineaceae bacterium]
MTTNPMPDPVATWEERYNSGSTPWDTGITPPEVKTFWASGRLDPKRVAGRYALDMGCGTGTNSAFLARLGLRVLGFDLSHTALTRGGPLPATVHLIQSSVGRLPVRGMQAVYVLDVGCLHSLSAETRFDYAKEIVDNLAPGGYYQLYAFDREETPENVGEWRWLADHEAEQLFAPHLEIIEIRQATPAPRPCRWYLMRKPGG